MPTIQPPSIAGVTRPVEFHPELLQSDEPVLLHLPELLDPGYCDAVADRLRTLSLVPYEATVGSDKFAPIPKLGPALFEFHDSIGEDEGAGVGRYLDQADKDAALIRSLFAGTEVPDPLEVLHVVAGELLGGTVTVAREGDRPYFSGVVRDMSDGAIPHYDDASVDTPDLAVGRTDRQVSILFYLTDFQGGGLTMYERKPTDEDNRERQMAYGYTWDTVQGLTFSGVAPRKGSVVVFNPRFLHSIASVVGDRRRLTFSAFIGRTESSDLISWS